MTPEIQPIEKDVAEEHQPPEPYIRQVEDRSRPAGDVLIDQTQGRAADEAPALFVP